MILYKKISEHRKRSDIITNHVHYPIAILLCAIISSTFITPNMVTLIATISELLAVWFIYKDLVEYRIIIVILLQLGWIFDLMDGMIARYKKLGFCHPTNPSLKGFYWDAVSDHVLRLIVLSFLGIHLAKQYDYGIYFAIAGISVSSADASSLN